jgi:hypothetical protein
MFFDIRQGNVCLLNRVLQLKNGIEYEKMREVNATLSGFFQALKNSDYESAQNLGAFHTIKTSIIIIIVM